MTRKSPHRRMGIWAAWAAAYAFALNTVLASFLLAATPASALAADHELCLSSLSIDAGHPAGDNGNTERVAVHCKLCVPGLAVAVLPPVAPIVFQRIAIAEPQQAAFELRLLQFSRFTQTSPRGPPALI